MQSFFFQSLQLAWPTAGRNPLAIGRVTTAYLGMPAGRGPQSGRIHGITGLAIAGLPGWSMTGNVFFLISRNLIIGETGEVVEILVVLAHVVDAEIQILSLAIAPHGCLVGARFLTPFPGTLIGSTRLFLFLLCPAGLDADLVKYVGI